MRKRTLLLAAVVVVGGTWALLRRSAGPDGDTQARIMSAVRTGEVSPPLAGVSARARVDVKALSPRKIGEDTASHEYHRYMNRCMACHAPPSPDLYTATEWPNVIERMHSNMRSAGTLGLNEEDRTAIAAFLSRHAKR